jgi:hypothetical protein
MKPCYIFASSNLTIKKVMNREHKLLQLFHSGVLADSVRHYNEAGIPDKVTAEKFLLQSKAAPTHIKPQ